MQNKLYGSPELQQQQQLRVLERGSEREKLNLKTFHTPHTTRCVFFVSFRIVSRCAFVDFQCFVAIFRLYLNYCVCCVCLSRYRYSCRYIDTETHRYTIYLCFAWLSCLTFPNAQRGADALKVARTNLTDTRYGTDWLHTRRTTDNAVTRSGRRTITTTAAATTTIHTSSLARPLATDWKEATLCFSCYSLLYQETYLVYIYICSCIFTFICICISTCISF